MASVKGRMPDTEAAGTGAQAAATGADQTAIGENFLTVYRRYIDALRDTHERAQRRYCDAQADYTRSVTELQYKSHRAREDAFRAYVAGLQDARGEEAHRRSCDAEQQYIKDLEAAQSAERKALEEASAAAASVIQQTSEQAGKEREAARLTYSIGVRDGFAKADPVALGPEVMALIGQSLVAASTYASPASQP